MREGRDSKVEFVLFSEKEERRLGMALFGNLEDFPLVELLSLIGSSQKTGVLELMIPSRQNIYISFARGRIQGVTEGRRALDPFEGRFLLMEIVNVRNGAFEFHLMPVGIGYDWCVEGFLMLVASVEDEMEAYRNNLPDVRTHFSLRGNLKENILDEPLLSFWRKARVYLERPISVRELAKVLHIPEEHVGYYLHKMRLLGLVEVRRAVFTERISEEKRDVWSRLWNGIRRFVGVAGG